MKEKKLEKVFFVEHLIEKKHAVVLGRITKITR
jgi:hypothetical protein